MKTQTLLSIVSRKNLLYLGFLVMIPLSCRTGNHEKVEWYLTNPDKSALLTHQLSINPEKSRGEDTSAIIVDEFSAYQQMDGFGFALTGGSAIHINAMEPGSRKALLNELFGKADSSISVSYLRVSIGASDLSDRVFSYNDLPPGETDPEMKKFSIDPERKDLIPVLKKIIAINPSIKILGSPWSPPVWMKTNGSSKGGSLKPEFYDAYALYFVKYIESMMAEGITIDAITIQNEPLHPGNNPSMFMPPEEQAAFIKNSLGPAFKKAGIKTKIIIYDHNPNRTDYPLAVLSDPDARKYVDGTAFHMYEGEVDAISDVKKAHPDKNLYFTEQWVGAPGNFAGDVRWHIKTLIIGAVRNWCRNVIEWNLAADQNQDPHTEGGCTECLGAVTIDGNNVTRNPAYYIIAHASKFVEPGSIRIGSNIPDKIPNVAFKTPDGKIVVIALNDSDSDLMVTIKLNDRRIKVAMKPGAVATFIW
jgi:glucosylceramidase